MKTSVAANHRRPRRLRLSLGAWRRAVNQIDARRAYLDWRTKAAYWLSGSGYSLLDRIQRASHADKIRAAVPSPPLFLLGFWRSGTTFLHELFCCDKRFGFASTYACMNPSHFLLTEKWVRDRPSSMSHRPMDNMQYSWASPQEDEFALFALGAPSAYEVLIAPSLMRDARSLLDLRQRSPDEQNRWGGTLQYFIQLLTLQQSKTMVLKSPPHGFKLPLLPSLFPRSRYVVIERNPYEVFASNVRLWRTLFDLYSVETVSSDEVESFVLAAYVLHQEAIADGMRQIDSPWIACLRYEDLVANPLGQMARLYDALELKQFEGARRSIEGHLASVAGHKRNRFQLTQAQKQKVDSAWGRFIRAKGYEWPGQYISLG